MKGAELILKTLAANDVGVCFTNPGTSEMAFVEAADHAPEVRMVLALFEGVASGAADGYARVAGRPSSTLLHLGPGYANAMANLHNARKARTPIVNIVGDHATHHLALDAPLTSNLPAIADAFSVWSKACSPHRPSADTAEAVLAAVEGQGPATLIVPGDVAWGDAIPDLQRRTPRARRLPAQGVAEEAAKKLRAAGSKALIIVSHSGLTDAGVKAAGAIAAATGASLASATFNTNCARGAGRPFLPRVPYFAEQATEFLARFSLIVLAGAAYPVSFFAYPGKPSLLPPSPDSVFDLATPAEDAAGALHAVAEVLGAAAKSANEPRAERPGRPSGEITLESLAVAVARHLPEGAIVSDESATSGGMLLPLTKGCPPHQWLDLMGGSIGQGLPLATGAAVGAPEAKILTLSGDGGAMYTIQSLWTQARENLDVTTLIFNNGAYRILNVEYNRICGQAPPNRARALLDIDRPRLDFVAIAKGLGVAADRAETAERLDDLLADAMAQKGPRLIEVMI
ncbi:acetolactate synthase large subunit [Zavarzinia sp. CC-PAN008]|uniref:acetolactate synthase large subunit n=1 Tax=Zavarzinia sp. CC-PAN008 TaxID=3243332 RepID=UPI003F7424A0